MLAQVKSPKWRQRTPHDQFTSICGAMEGCMDNFREGIITGEAMANTLEAYTQELKSLVYFLNNPKEW